MLRSTFTLSLFVILFQFSAAQNIYLASDLDAAGGAAAESPISFDGDLITGTVVEYFADGKPRVWKTVKNGYADGRWLEWYANGRLKYSAQWQDGYGHGMWIYYFENGSMRQQEYYDRDTPVGIHSAYYDNGQLKSRGGHLEGKKHGPWQYYSSDGQTARNEIYDLGELISEK